MTSNLMTLFAGDSGAGGGGCSSLVVTDAFTDTDGVQIENHGANWALNGGALDILTNQLGPDQSGPYSAARWISDTFYDDQYSKATVTTFRAARYMGVAVRLQSDNSSSYYGFFTDNVKSFLGVLLNGSLVGGGPDMAPLAANDLMEIRAVGTTITALVNGVAVDSIVDSNFSSGSAGVCGNGDNFGAANTKIDNWEGGNICP